MKQKDIAIIVISVVISGIFAYIICSQFIFSTAKNIQKAEVVKPINSILDIPDKTVFNSEAINPTKLIEIGPNTNTQPFANQ